MVVEQETKNESPQQFINDDRLEPEQSVKAPGIIKNWLGRVRDAYRGLLVDDSLPPEDRAGLVGKFKEEISSVAREAIREGVDFSKCQMDAVIRDHRDGLKVEFETFSPYLADYNTATGEIWADKLVPADQIGLKVGALLRRVLYRARMISLYDEYNSDMANSADFWGKPTKQLDAGSKSAVDAPQLEFTAEAKRGFRSSLKKLMSQDNLKLIRAGDKEGKDYLFISESAKIKEAEILVEKLESQGLIKRDGQAINFVNKQAENPLYQEIPLRTKNGRWLCEALDASSYIKPENFEITHLVVLPKHFEEQQDKVWEILRSLGISSERYHNIFYDEKTPPETVERVVREEIEKYL